MTPALRSVANCLSGQHLLIYRDVIDENAGFMNRHQYQCWVSQTALAGAVKWQEPLPSSMGPNLAKSAMAKEALSVSVFQWQTFVHVQVASPYGFAKPPLQRCQSAQVSDRQAPLPRGFASTCWIIKVLMDTRLLWSRRARAGIPSCSMRA